MCTDNPSDLALRQARAAIDEMDHKVAHHVVQLAPGCHMRWRCFGEGAPLILIHGGHGTWLHWLRNIDALAQKRSVWLPNLPGYGDSDVCEPMGLEKMIEAIGRSIDELIGTHAPVDLAGFSFGGLVAANVAARRSNVGRLALVGTAGHGGERRQTREMANWRRARDEPALYAALRNNLLSLMLHDDSRIDALALEIHRVSCATTRFRSRTLARSHSVKEPLDRISGPTLLVWGEHDVTTSPREVGATLAAGRKNRRYRVVEGAGHWVQYERADETNRLLFEWLGENVAS